MLRTPAIERISENRHQTLRQHANAVLVALCFPNHDLTPREVEILDPQVKRLQEPKAGAVEQRRDCRRLAVQCSKQGGHFLLSQHRRQPLRLTRSDDIVEPKSHETVCNAMNAAKKAACTRVPLQAEHEIFIERDEVRTEAFRQMLGFMGKVAPL